MAMMSKNANRIGSRNVPLAGALLVCASLLAASASVAQAGQFWASSATLKPSGTLEFGSFSPLGVAVEPATGDVYESEGEFDREQKYDSALLPKFLLAFGAGVNQESGNRNICTVAATCTVGERGTEPGEFSGAPNYGRGVAVNPANGDVYVADSESSRVEYFQPDGTYLHQFNGIEIDGAPAAKPAPAKLELSIGIAADAAGGIYVFDYGHRAIDKFTAAGEYLCQITGSATASGSECYEVAGIPTASPTPSGGLGVCSDPGADLATDASGDVYFADCGNDVVYEFAPNGEYLKDFGSGMFQGESPGAVAVDSAGHVFAADGSQVYEFAPSGDLIATIGASAIDKAMGLAASGSGRSERLYVSDDGSKAIQVFTPGPSCATEEPATNVTASSAEVPGLVEPNGFSATSQFDYGLTSSYGDETTSQGPLLTTTHVIGALSGLQPHQTYHFELALEVDGSKVECEPDRTLLTLSAPPSVDEQSIPSSGEIGQTGATLRAEVNPNNEVTRWQFAYATNSALSGASAAPAAPGELPAAFGDHTISTTLVSLEPNTLYYYRTIAENEAGLHGGSTSKAEGPIQSFLTRPATPTAVAATGIGQNAVTLNGTVEPGGHDLHYYFQYTSAHGSGTTPVVDAGAGTATVAADAQLSGLDPLTTYHVTLIVANASGNVPGPEFEVTTLPLPPSVFTGAAVNVSDSGATLMGSINPQGADATYRFQYGTTIAYGSEAPVPEGEVQPVSGIEGATGVTEALADLAPATEYHYRFMAKNSGGETVGEDRTFTTNVAGEPNLDPIAAGFSLTETGTALTGPAEILVPDLASLTPLESPKATASLAPPMATKELTLAQKLAKALKACKKDRSRRTRAKCEKAARTKYRGR
jgi:DNA-binding beta-propeller fold protein YncE